jgi:hypothetical protein
MVVRLLALPTGYALLIPVKRMSKAQGLVWLEALGKFKLYQNLFTDTTNASVTMMTALRSSLSMYIFFVYR